MSYGRNFEVIVPPHGRDRRGRFFLDSTTAVPIGAPGIYSLGGDEGAVNALGMNPVILATGADLAPTEMSGIMVYEHAPNAYAGFDPVLTDYSDIDTIPAKGAVQLIRGEYVKVRFTNTAASTFLNTRSYAARTMVAPANLSSIAVGDALNPAATPNDTNGYWKEATSAANAWLVVTKVDTARGEVEAQMTF